MQDYPKVRVTKTYSVSLETIARIKSIAKLRAVTVGHKVFDADVIEEAINKLYAEREGQNEQARVQE